MAAPFVVMSAALGGVRGLLLLRLMLLLLNLPCAIDRSARASCLVDRGERARDGRECVFGVQAIDATARCGTQTVATEAKESLGCCAAGDRSNGRSERAVCASRVQRRTRLGAYKTECAALSPRSILAG